MSRLDFQEASREQQHELKSDPHLAAESTSSAHHIIKNEQRNVAEAHLDAGSVGGDFGMGSQCHWCNVDRQRRDLAAILGPGSLGGDQRVARRYHAAPRRDRNDGDVAAPGMGPRRVGRGDRLGGGRGRGAVTLDGATRLVEGASSAQPIILSRPASAISPRT